MNFWEAIIFGIVQGIGEFLPISSSAHLIATSSILDGSAMPLAVNVALHLGTVGAVLIYFWSDWAYMLVQFFKKVRGEPADNDAVRTLVLLALGTIPAGIIGLAFKSIIETHLHSPLVIVLPLALVGIALYVVDKKAKVASNVSQLSLGNVLLVGVMQALALIPGVSRSGSTIIGARLVGLGREEAARFSFLLGTPIMLGAALLELPNIAVAIKEPNFVIAVVASFLTGCFAIKFLLGYLKRHGFGVFAVYRVILAGGVLYLFWP